MLTLVDCSVNRMAVMGKEEAGKSFGIVRMAVLHRDGRGIEKWYQQCP